MTEREKLIRDIIEHPEIAEELLSLAKQLVKERNTNQ